MASYHRVLETFGRSVNDITLECDCDIHPWELAINDEQWAGKIRLIGFVDVFFLISYSANARFEHGIIVYKDKLALEQLTGIKSTKHVAADEEHPEPEENLDNAEDPNATTKSDEDAKTKPADAPADSKKGAGDQKDEEITSPEFRKTSTLSIKSLGHPIGLRASYPKSWIRPYKVEITKPASWALSKRIMRGLKPHSTYDLMSDVIRCGIITQGQLAGHIMGVLLAGSRLDDTTKKYLDGLTSGSDAGRQALSNEKI
ncbi:uncharacterized protein N7483_006859 [Penicillium malachiteum]|uniref:uncharacterized protein n=1 Tax=Penicillium malachiteum TaxID=1324776 RepID=UPI002546F40B|nr:uncharacterized protein N7483_006859 [Penicillium malachiteum]KAJ5725502.1 hypothetical protein N7483_006859 [Penicillium malachiteum]